MWIKEVDPHVRQCCYHILLEHPDVVIKFFAHQGSWYGKKWVDELYKNYR